MLETRASLPISVTRLLHEKRSVIHRDISRGNVVFMPDGDTFLPPSATHPPGPAQQTNPASNDPEACSPAPSAHQPRAAVSPELAQQDFNRGISTTNRGQAKTERKYCFVKCLLRERYVHPTLDHHVAPDVGFSEDPRESNMLLIDFNRSEDLQSLKQRDASHAHARTVGALRS